MAIDDKPTPAWDESDLQELCDEQRREQPNLEFKQELPLDRPSEKADVEHDVQGLANSGGGHIIYGIKEGDAGDGSKVAVGLLPLADGGLYDRLNNLLDGRGDPKVPFEIYAIPAAAGGIYLVVHVHGYRGPHMANDNRFYIRRNLLVRPMTAAEVEDGYKQKVVRERSIFGGGEQEPAGGEVEPRIKQGLDDLELAAYRQETGDDMPPGWLSVWTHPEPPVPDLLDPRDHDVYEFRRLQVAELWRGNPLDYLSIAKTNSGFVGRLPPGSDGYPAYYMRFWPDGLLEYGWLQAPAVRRPAPAWNRLIPTHAIPEYVHDFLVLSAAVFAGLGYHDAVVARARLNNVAGYRLAVEPSRFLETTELGEDMVESRRWQGPAGELVDGARKVAHDISDRLFIAGGVSGGAYFFDDEGSYTGRR